MRSQTPPEARAPLHIQVVAVDRGTEFSAFVSFNGGKNWQPMSFNPQTGLVYIPSINLCMDMEGAEPTYQRGKFYLAFEFDLGKGGPGGYMSELMAWDPVKQQKAWGNKDELPWLGGTLTTKGGLAFHGDIKGWFKALDAKTGQLLWQFNTGSGISAASKLIEANWSTRLSGRTAKAANWLAARLPSPRCATWTPLGCPVEPEV